MPKIVQHSITANPVTVGIGTFSQMPAQGNLLVAVVAQTIPLAPAGWVVNSILANQVGGGIFYGTVGGGSLAGIVPALSYQFSAGVGSIVELIEISGGGTPQIS